MVSLTETAGLDDQGQGLRVTSSHLPPVAEVAPHPHRREHPIPGHRVIGASGDPDLAQFLDEAGKVKAVLYGGRMLTAQHVDLAALCQGGGVSGIYLQRLLKVTQRCIRLA